MKVIFDLRSGADMSHEVLYHGNVALWKMVRARVEQSPPIPMSAIAAEIGVGVDELCAWIMDYRAPKSGYLDKHAGAGWSVAASAQHHDNWKRAHEAAKAALAAPEVLP